ncbi:Deafness [Mactra antiquata]
MMDTEPLKSKPAVSQLMSEYNRISKISLKGKFGAEISKEILDAELEASDTISLNIKFGKVEKLEVKEPELLQELSNRRINLDHTYIQQIREDSSKVLCLITGVARLPNGGSINRETEVDAKATLSAHLIKKGSVSTEGSRSNERDIGLAPLTPVAYNIHELNVDKHSGAMQLVLAKGSHGGFKDSIGYDEVDATCVSPGLQDAGHQQRKQLEMDLNQPLNIFKPLYDLPLETRSQLNEWLFYLLTVPRDMLLLSELIDDAEQGRQVQVKITELKDKFLSTNEYWMKVLQFIGFTIQENHLVAPPSVGDRFHALGEFLDAATMLEDETLDLIRDIPSENVKSLLTVIKEGIKGNSINDVDVIQPLIDNNSCIKLLLELQFRIQDNVFDPPLELPYIIDEVYWVIFALYWKN